MISDLANGAVIAWSDHRAASSDVYAQRVNSAGIKQWSPDGNPLIATAGSEMFAAMISDFSSGIVDPLAYYVATFEDGSGAADFIRLQRVDVFGSGLWTTASAGGVVVASGNSMYGVCMSSDGVGSVFDPKGAVLAWVDFRSGAPGDIYARRVSPNGALQWAANGVAVCVEGSQQTNPAIASVSAGKAIIVWADFRNSATTGMDIYGQMIDSAGNTLWSGNGIPICNFSGSQNEPKILRDNAGGAFVIWLDSRQFPGPDVFAQRINASGQPLWDPNGVPLSTIGQVEQIDTDHHMLPSETGFIASWSDLRTSPSDVYVQRLDADGNVQWGNEAKPLCTAPGHSWDPMLASDGSSGVIATWMDGRNSNLDIFANRIPFSGGGVDAPVMESGAPPFSLVTQNPMRGQAQITLHLHEASRVSLEVFDVTGRRARTISMGDWLEAGTHPFIWDGNATSGVPVPAGMYFLRAAALDRTTTSRLVLLR